MKEIKNNETRYYILIGLIILITIILIIALFDMQIINGESYRERSSRKVTRTAESYAPRGEIYDRNGNLLATNEVSYTLNLFRTKSKQDDLNDLLLKIAGVLIKNGDNYISNLPIDFENKKFTINGDNLKRWKENNNIKEEFDIQETIDELVNRYKLQEYDDYERKLLIPFRYELSNSGYSNYRMATVAKNISIESVHELEENNFDYPGIYITKDTKRSYPYGNTLSHVIGYTGIISQSEYDARKDDGYTLNSIVGKAGIESSFEKYLKGINGSKRIEMDSNGVINSIEEIDVSKAGRNIYLTIDIELQKKTEEVLKDIIWQIQNGKINNLKYSDARAGSAIVLNVKTGEVLALANYPDYNPQEFVDGISQAKYDEYFNNQDKPMYNRAIQGLYPPGSTYKMVTGIAAMESGAISSTELINDLGVYNKGHKPACWLWNSRRQTHGSVNARTALMVSCNYYYYEVSSRMGIDTLASYARKFGLGQKTGIELYGEEKGTVSSREYVEEQNEKGRKLTWTIGDTLSSSIGQSYNLFTPIQMTKYIATIANKGKKQDVTLIKKVTDSIGNEEDLKIIKNEVDERLGVLNQEDENIDIQESSLNAIFEGMKSVTGDRGGTVYGTFNDFPIEVAGKTGTATSGNGSDNAWFVGFAPYDDPEIAVVVIVEHGGHGYFTARAVKDIMKEYFKFE